jgi:hypothetical protein
MVPPRFDEMFLTMTRPRPAAARMRATTASATFFGWSGAPKLSRGYSGGGGGEEGRSSAGTTTSESQYWHLTSALSIRSNSSVAPHCGQLKTFNAWLPS